ncbi:MULTISPECIES: TetR/AcrR family transcriptional regulator [Bacillus]|uniref:TetR/AcrR family transcriptional regulator n=1 Tax=Bacillus TaxID=1386 RepID=UPI0007AB806C|nr:MULTISPECIES: TetR/AcrR family transcriptional regulator [Bacillus]MDG1618267.1 TetR/AcrR family transcriptional regulator C-terminal domain-containing protein [Bacillus mobilis]MDX5838874.1 TetR/AcrR family transcriptional regulator [Bacillus cereus group sp. BfR-BA-01700]MED4383508.1 TetR/AcrR family transcriptional regulator C-terminal domain-containing protein [Bacillus mobilis]NEK99975.1 TetR family transcriptional regulator [Bacillus mobilis]OJE48355.1 TetR family transcriptional regu
MNDYSFSHLLEGDSKVKKNRPKYNQIIDAAVIVIAEKGYHQAQVSKIAKQAGVADGTIYLYFKNKEDILISLFQEKMGEFVETIRQKTAGIESAVSKLFMLVETHFLLLSQNDPLAIVTQLELRQSNQELRLKINEVLKGYLQVMDEILETGIKQGEFQADLNVRVARQMIFGTVDEVVTNWVMSDHKYDLVALSKTVHGLLIAACGYRQ